jgi:hypothetical protein
MVQIPNRGKAFWSFEIEIWDLFGIWDLEFQTGLVPAMQG